MTGARPATGFGARVPLRARPEQAPDLACTRQVSSLPRTKSEVLAFPRLESGQPGMGSGGRGNGPGWSSSRLVRGGGRLRRHGHRLGLNGGHRRDGKPVSRVRPAGHLLGILTGRLDLRGQALGWNLFNLCHRLLPACAEH